MQHLVCFFAGKSDPFVSLTVGKETRKSKAAKGKIAKVIKT